jgi:SAM-dependent methyltransferase
MNHSIQIANARVWQKLYSEGKNDLRYPNDVLVRMGARLFDASQHKKILDFGFGTGANLIHFASRGFQMSGVEISEHAIAITRERLCAANLTAELHLVRPGEPLSFPSGTFDLVYAWQVICYSDRPGWRFIVKELERVTRAEGLIIVATVAPGDIFHLMSEPLGNGMYRLLIPGQEGCMVTIPKKDELADYFPGRQLEIGDFGFSFGGRAAHYWIVMYQIPQTPNRALVGVPSDIQKSSSFSSSVVVPASPEVRL